MPIPDGIARESEMLSTVAAGDITNPGAGRLPAAWSPRGANAWWWALGAAALMLGLAYAPNFRDLYRTWCSDENYKPYGMFALPTWLDWLGGLLLRSR